MKKLIAMSLVVALVLSFGLMPASIVAADGKAAPKVTGDVWLTPPGGVPIHIWFVAQEAYAGRPVKGEFHQEFWPGGSYYCLNGYVTEAHIYSGYADFATYIYDVGQTLYVHVHDGGEPGIGVDTVDGGFNPDYASYGGWPIYEGNLVVHN